MNSNQPPRRGPRVMHGIAAIMRKAGPAPGPLFAAADLMGEYAARIADIASLMTRLKKAEQQVARVNAVIDAFKIQMEPLPADNQIRKIGEQIINTFGLAVK